MLGGMLLHYKHTFLDSSIHHKLLWYINVYTWATEPFRVHVSELFIYSEEILSRVRRNFEEQSKVLESSKITINYRIIIITIAYNNYIA
jgi:hypothetical protein